MDRAEVEAKLTGYATEFIRGYSEALDQSYADTVQKVVETGFGSALFPLYCREFGKDVAVASLFTANDFYLFFVDARNTTFVVWKDGDEASDFSQEWALTAPSGKRVERVKEYLGIA